MTDDLDMAKETEEFSLRNNLKTRREAGPDATGECLNCGEVTALRWCNAECRDEWQEEQRRRMMADD